MVVSEKLRMEALAAGQETFEEADDFDVDDDFDPTSPYEVNFDPPLPPQTPAANQNAAPQTPTGGSPGTSPPVDTKTP